MRDSGYFGPGGEFTWELPGKNRQVHFHAHTNQIMTALEAVQATGDQQLLAFARTAFDYALSQGETLQGLPHGRGAREGQDHQAALRRVHRRGGEAAGILGRLECHAARASRRSGPPLPGRRPFLLGGRYRADLPLCFTFL